MIPVCLVTGFLGSGKTTLLRQMAERHRGRKLVFVVNEFSAADVDGEAMRQVAPDVVAIPGGSIFCTCLVGEFIRVLTGLPERFHSNASPMDGVVIEASGIANPKVVEQMLRETGLDEMYALTSILAVADPGTFPVLLQTLPNITAQIECSDVVVLNKTDLFGESEIARAEEAIRGIRPGVSIVRSRFCDVDLPLFDAHTPRGLRGLYAACADSHYAALCVRTERKVDIEALCGRLRRLPGLYRAKGFVRTRGGAHYVDATMSNISVQPVPGHAGAFEMALIVGREHAAAAETLAKDIEFGHVEREDGM